MYGKIILNDCLLPHRICQHQHKFVLFFLPKRTKAGREIHNQKLDFNLAVQHQQKCVRIFICIIISFIIFQKNLYTYIIYISIFKIPLPLYIYFGRFSLFIVGIFGLAPFSVYELENGLKISIILFSVLFNFAIFGQHKILPINEIQSKLIVIQFVIVYVVVGEQ